MNTALMALYIVGAIFWAYKLRSCRHRWTRWLCAASIAVMMLCAFGRGVSVGMTHPVAKQEQSK